MGRKMKLPFLSKNTTTASPPSSASPWAWPSCNQPRTLSFRNSHDTNTVIKTVNNSAYLLDAEETTQSSLFTKCTTSSTDQSGFSMAASDQEYHCSGEDPIEAMIRGLRSETERLFFEPGGVGETSSILDEATAYKTSGDIIIDDGGLSLPDGFKESLVCSMESQDPYIDFKKSMEGIVEAHGIKDWEHLEELLCWYLRMNGKSNHGYIVGAFVDLLVALAFASSSSSPSPSSATTTTTNDFVTCTASSSSSSLLLASNSCASPSSPLSFSTSCESSSTSTPTCLSYFLEAEDDEEEEEILKKQQKHDDGASIFS